MKNSWLQSKLLAPLSIAAVTIGIIACGPPEEEKKKSKNDAVSQNVESIADGFVPGSLKVANSSALMLSSDPCAGMDFFACQPKMLKIYVKMAEDVVKLVKNFAKPINDYAGTKEDGSEGSDPIEAKEEGDANKISYKKVSANEYKVIMSVDDKPIVMVDVKKDGDKFHYAFDFMMVNTKDFDSKQMKKFRSEATFTDANTFKMRFRMADVPCNPNDVKGIDFLAIAMEKADGKWKGKTIMRSPRWATSGTPSCDTAVTADTKLYTYTDFVGTDAKATSSLYLAKSTLTDITNLSDWATQHFCTKHGGCTDGKFTTSGPIVANTYQSPFCVNANADTATWGAACTDLPVTDYSSPDVWMLPSKVDEQIQGLVDFTGPAL